MTADEAPVGNEEQMTAEPSAPQDRMAVPNVRRLSIEIRGAVQGVGFRPFVYRLATEMGLAGWVINDSQGVFVEVEGSQAVLQRFLARLPAEKPPRAIVQTLSSAWLPAVGYARFEIRHSDGSGAKTVFVLPDVAACSDCLAELLDPSDRRYGYPFTNCTNCGPRFTIIQALPYDRPNTTMRRFTMCPECLAEYENPLDRRFHAQPNACPVCGPRLALYHQGTQVAEGDGALRGAAEALAAGRIVAVKGLGGFHLMVDAANGEAIRRLRASKPRRDKPFAVMVRDLAQATVLCELLPESEALLSSPEAPIVLLRRRTSPPTPLPQGGGRAGDGVSDEVAPGNPNLGIMLPYTPLHHLLLADFGRPVVATSGNLTDEPICTDETEAMQRLGPVADLFLVHDRPIERHVDDSVAWIVCGAPRLLRRARGYAPLPVSLSESRARGKDPVPTILAVGAHFKNTVALSVGQQVFISQHIGDLETPEAMAAFERVIADFLRLYEASPVAIAHDLHPDYLSTQWALSQGGLRGPSDRLRCIAVQHHHAHLAACLAENLTPQPPSLQGKGEAYFSPLRVGEGAGVRSDDGLALGVTWDGTGYGTDGTIWGGEFLLGNAEGFERVAHLRPFRLPGGDAAVREPRRAALALLWELYGEASLEHDELPPLVALRPAERQLLARMLSKGINAPLTTSAGRLFDGVAALIGLHQEVSFEGQAAMALEFAADEAEQGAYPLLYLPGDYIGSPLQVDWGPMLEAILADLRRRVPKGIIAARFHNALVEAIVAVAQIVGQPQVALTGGCFQNRLLTERAAHRLEAAGFRVLLHRQVPPNDGGISLGQVAVAAAQLQMSTGQERGF